MPFERRDKEIAAQPAPEEINGAILLDESGTEMSCEYSIVFMNSLVVRSRGEKDGGKPGQRYDIYHQDRNEVDGKEVLLSKYVFGEMMVLIARETTATAVITKSLKPIRRGDRFKSSL